MRGTGRPTQLPGRVRVDMATLDALIGLEHHFGGAMAVRGGARSWRRRDRSSSRVVRRRNVLVRGTGRPTQLPGWMRVAIRTLGAFMANGPSLSGVVAVGSGIFLWRAPAKIVTTEKVSFWRCARLRAGAAIGRPPGARVITADQGPHRARSTRALGSDISNGVTRFVSSLYLSDCSTCHLPYVNDCSTCHAFGSVR